MVTMCIVQNSDRGKSWKFKAICQSFCRPIFTLFKIYKIGLLNEDRVMQSQCIMFKVMIRLLSTDEY